MAPELRDQCVPVLMTANGLEAPDTWRRAQGGLPSRGEAIRRRVASGLETTTKAEPST